MMEEPQDRRDRRDTNKGGGLGKGVRFLLAKRNLQRIRKGRCCLIYKRRGESLKRRIQRTRPPEG